MYKELEIKKRKVIDLQEDIKNKENFLASQNVFSSVIYKTHPSSTGDDSKFK